jgi:nucleotide-binding universal stress UspA family protein
MSMFKRILVAVDGSATAQRGLEAAAGLAADQRAQLLVLHVVDVMSYRPAQFNPTAAAYMGAYVEALRAHGRRVLDEAERFARSRRVRVETVLVDAKEYAVSRAIVDQSTKLRADVIVLGTHGRRGVQRLLLGSDAEAVLRAANVPVLIVRDAGMTVDRPRKTVRTTPALTRPPRATKRRRILPATLIESSQ